MFEQIRKTIFRNKECIDFLHWEIAKRDAKIAKLREQLDRSIQLDLDKLKPAQVANRMRALSEQQDETEQGQINALLYGRAAIALDSDPYAECFTEEVQVDYIARESGKSIPAFIKERPVPTVVPPLTNGGRIRAMADEELARFFCTAINAVADLVWQYAPRTKFYNKPALWNEGLSALENAFWILQRAGVKVNSNGTIQESNLQKFMERMEETGSGT